MHQLAHDGGSEHGVDDEMEPLPVAEVEDVRLHARREVVEGEHLVALVEDELGEM